MGLLQWSPEIRKMLIQASVIAAIASLVCASCSVSPELPNLPTGSASFSRNANQRAMLKMFHLKLGDRRPVVEKNLRGTIISTIPTTLGRYILEISTEIGTVQLGLSQKPRNHRTFSDDILFGNRDPWMDSSHDTLDWIARIENNNEDQR